ncbi:MAG: PaaX family transcriptional regulator C-terminal domain-containing protein [Frankiaceae bacterium]
MHARSALFDLYGDHLRRRGGSAPVSALVRLLSPLGIAAPAVRTAVSRMVRQGWLVPVRLPTGPGYALTPRAAARLDDAAGRVYRTADRPWDSTWHLLHTDRVRHRATRDRLRSGLAFLGYAPLDETTWIAPRPSREAVALLAAEGVAAESFLAGHDGDSARLVAMAWDLGELAATYDRWLATAREVVAGAGPEPDDETAFAVRSALVHEWRKFLFRDPGLPAALLPSPWPGERAAAYFDRHAARLLPAADRFVDTCLSPGGAATRPYEEASAV